MCVNGVGAIWRGFWWHFLSLVYIFFVFTFPFFFSLYILFFIFPLMFILLDWSGILYIYIYILFYSYDKWEEKMGYVNGKFLFGGSTAG